VKIQQIEAVLDVSAYDTTAVNISASLPDQPKAGEAVSFVFDGDQDVDFFLGNSDKSLSVKIGVASQRADFGPFDADALRNAGHTYLWASASASAGTVSILRVSEP
jgi:hypothetical protein